MTINKAVLCFKHPLCRNGLRFHRNLSKGQRAELGLRIGRRVKILGGVGIQQNNEVWEIIDGLGLTQLHMLWRGSDRVSKQDLSTDSPAQVFYLCLAFKQSYSDDTPLGPAILTAEELGELAQGLGEDLDILRSLDKDQIFDILNRIYKARYLYGYQYWLGQEIANIDLDTLMAGFDEHPIPMNFEDFLLFDGPELESGYQNTLVTPSNAVHPGNTPEAVESGMMLSPVSISTETNAVFAYPTPASDALMAGSDEHPIPMNFEDFLVFDGPELESGYQNTLVTPSNAVHPGNAPEAVESGMILSPVSISTETNAVFAYPTPASDELDSPQPPEKPTRTMSPRTPNDRRAKGKNKGKKRLLEERQEKTAGAGRKLNPIAKTLLKGNNPKLNDEDTKRVLEVDACILPPDPLTLKSLSDQWNNNESQGQHALGLPKEWIGIHAAWNYVRELEAKTLNPVAENVAYILLHFNYKELCKYSEHYCGRPLRRHERANSCVYDCIIEAAYPDGRTRELEGPGLYKKIGKHIRKAKWCWEIVANLGAGVLLRGEWLTKCYNRTLSKAGADALVTYILNTRPGTARLFRSLEPTTKILMFGGLPELIKTLRAGGNDLQDQLSTASTEDEEAWASQSTESRWDLIHAANIAEERISDFLYLTQSCAPL